VVEAAENGKFRIFAVHSIDEGIEILTGWPAGRRGRGGTFPAKTINALVEERLRSFALTRRQFAGRPDGKAEGEALQ
jgi:hypothetical protein